MKNQRIEAAIIAFGLLAAGFFVFKGFRTFSERDRTVQVRGFSEKNVPADKVVWPIPYQQAGNDLNALYNNASRAMEIITQYLVRNGIAANEISVSTPKIEDNWSSGYSNKSQVQHYRLLQVATVTTHRVEEARRLMGHMQDLLREGVPVASDYSAETRYEFTQLDSIKPQMVAEATHSARQAAEKFAKDSGSKIGKIKHATQGYFSVEDRDTNTPYIKKVRVVTSVEYYLDN
ncbi:MAG: SIMPL domain-containing protein [Bacteroidaceae bacterium]|nr:SIMPL domain-containing protein [Bacteroidaceae bacterium]